jgi:hypothetical protein
MALDLLDPFDLKRRIQQVDRVRSGLSLAADLDFLRTARRALLPLPLVDRDERIPADVFPPHAERPIPELRRQRVGVVGSGGSGGAIALVGMARAFEEAGVRPAAISACSGSAIWGAMWAAGLTAREMAEFSLSWRPQDYLDVQWTRLPLLALRGFTGLAKGDALERLFDRRLWRMAAGETRDPVPHGRLQPRPRPPGALRQRGHAGADARRAGPDRRGAAAVRRGRPRGGRLLRRRRRDRRVPGRAAGRRRRLRPRLRPQRDPAARPPRR